MHDYALTKNERVLIAVPYLCRAELRGVFCIFSNTYLFRKEISSYCNYINLKRKSAHFGYVISTSLIEKWRKDQFIFHASQVGLTARTNNHNVSYAYRHTRPETHWWKDDIYVLNQLHARKDENWVLLIRWEKHQFFQE